METVSVFWPGVYSNNNKPFQQILDRLTGRRFCFTNSNMLKRLMWMRQAHLLPVDKEPLPSPAPWPSGSTHFLSNLCYLFYHRPRAFPPTVCIYSYQIQKGNFYLYRCLFIKVFWYIFLNAYIFI